MVVIGQAGPPLIADGAAYSATLALLCCHWDELYERYGGGGGLHPSDPEWVRGVAHWHGQAVLFEHMWGGQNTLRDITGFAAMAELFGDPFPVPR